MKSAGRLATSCQARPPLIRAAHKRPIIVAPLANAKCQDRQQQDTSQHQILIIKPTPPSRASCNCARQARPSHTPHTQASLNKSARAVVRRSGAAEQARARGVGTRQSLATLVAMHLSTVPTTQRGGATQTNSVWYGTRNNKRYHAVCWALVARPKHCSSHPYAARARIRA